MIGGNSKCQGEIGFRDLKRIVVKVGTATLTSPEGKIDQQFINSLAAQISRLRKQGKEVALVTSGAIRSGIERLNLTQPPKTMPELQAAAAVGQGLLMQVYTYSFEEYHQPVAQVLLTREDVSERRRYLNARNTLFRLFQYKVVPIINENDTVATEEIKFGDNDLLAALVAGLIEADLLINLSDVEGLYLVNRKEVEKPQVLEYIEEITPEIEELAGETKSIFGTGGMASKIQAAKISSSCGVPMVIAKGRQENVILDIVKGKPLGTFFVPKESKLSSRKRWIAFGLPPKGKLVINEGAKRMIVECGKSLLPAGVTKVEGVFEAGDSVSLVDERNQEFARGLTNYRAAEIEIIKGLHTSQIEKNLGYKDFDEIIHRDNLVLL